MMRFCFVFLFLMMCFYFMMMMRFILYLFIQSFIYLKLYSTPIPIISNEFYPFLSNPKNFKQTLSIGCL
ncbi:hypothetical protein D8X81_07165 [Helicobacter pylori]|nr:hypothetical protein D8X81_05235 [Helicobacter pylori]QDK11768.1 hypothetical protein D8X81_07165 [Helicobacter pylori]